MMITADRTERFLRLPEVQERTGFSRSFIYKGVSDKTFPSPRKVGGRASVWLDSEVIEWMNRISDNTQPERV